MPAVRPLTPTEQVELERARLHVDSLPGHLLLPGQWAELTLTEAVALAGTPEGAAKLAECRRYLACEELSRRLAQRCAELSEEVRRLQGVLASPGYAVPERGAA